MQKEAVKVQKEDSKEAVKVQVPDPKQTIKTERMRAVRIKLEEILE